MNNDDEYVDEIMRMIAIAPEIARAMTVFVAEMLEHYQPQTMGSMVSIIANGAGAMDAMFELAAHRKRWPDVAEQADWIRNKSRERLSQKLESWTPTDIQ